MPILRNGVAAPIANDSSSYLLAYAGNKADEILSTRGYRSKCFKFRFVERSYSRESRGAIELSRTISINAVLFLCCFEELEGQEGRQEQLILIRKLCWQNICT